jgi:hypothetical protein
MLFILISLMLNLNAYAETPECKILVSNDGQVTSSISLVKNTNSDNAEIFTIKATKANDGTQIVDIYKTDNNDKKDKKNKKDKKTSKTIDNANTSISSTDLAALEDTYDGDLIPLMSQDGKAEFHTKDQTLNIKVEDFTACSKESLALLLYIIDNFNV